MIHYNVKFSILKDNLEEKIFLLISGPLGKIKFQFFENKFTHFEIKSFFSIDFKRDCSIYELNQQEFKIWLCRLNMTVAQLSLLKKTIKKSIQFVCFGNFSYLKLVGIGYKIEQENQYLNLNLGYRHKILLSIPNNIKVFIPGGFKNQKLTLFGLDLESVILFRSQIREICKPESYKGKGIRFENEIILLKENKKNN